MADIAATEYKEGIFTSERGKLQGEIALAKSNIEKAEARLQRTLRARQRLKEIVAQEKDRATTANILAELDIDDRSDDAEQTLLRAKSAHEDAQGKLHLLQRYTYPRTVKSLNSEVERARMNELATQATWDLQKTKASRLRKMIENCKIYAASDGPVVHANDPFRRAGSPAIEEGSTVRERQKIFTIPVASSPLRVVAKVPESVVDWLRDGQKARVRIDAFPDEVLNGVVTFVSRLPDPGIAGRPDVKVYSVFVKLDNGLPALRPGFTAEFEIVDNGITNAMSVPLSAVVHIDDRARVAVKRPGGGFSWREVILGLANNEAVEIKQGLAEGNVVSLDPVSLLSPEERTRIVSPSAMAGAGRGRQEQRAPEKSGKSKRGAPR